MHKYQEINYEDAIISIFKELGYRHVYGPNLDNRDFYSLLYEGELVSALHRINPNLPDVAIKEALFKLKHFENVSLVQKNALFTDYLQNGITVHYMEKNEPKDTIVYLIDYQKTENNSFVVANQWTFIENSEKRPDILLFINGLPLVLVELKSPSREETNASEAYRQIRNYCKKFLLCLYNNAICAMSDLSISKAGTITSDETRFEKRSNKITA